MSFKQHFSKSIGRKGAALHFAAHSHHPWPDVTSEAQNLYWEDSAHWLDHKWEKIFAQCVPQAQSHIAKHLTLPDPSSICFAPNTHNFILRLLSAIPTRPTLKILATDGEFHSFTRQLSRLEEENLAEIVRVPVEPISTFKARFIAELQTQAEWDVVWLSQTFFNSGHVLTVSDLHDICHAIPSQRTFAVIDGYHAFMATPVDLSSIASRAFYIAGGYKYAMAGEGACFMHCPPGYGMRPRDTGWYAEFGALEKTREQKVGYASDASRFSGATFDASGLYRLNAVMNWLDGLKLSVAHMNAYCKSLQATMLQQLDAKHCGLSSEQLVTKDLQSCGRFLTFQTPHAAAVDEGLAKRNIIVDHRGDRLRIGFGIYQDEADVAHLVDALSVCS